MVKVGYFAGDRRARVTPRGSCFSVGRPWRTCTPTGLDLYFLQPQRLRRRRTGWLSGRLRPCAPSCEGLIGAVGMRGPHRSPWTACKEGKRPARQITQFREVFRPGAAEVLAVTGTTCSPCGPFGGDLAFAREHRVGVLVNKAWHRGC